MSIQALQQLRDSCAQAHRRIAELETLAGEQSRQIAALLRAVAVPPAPAVSPLVALAEAPAVPASKRRAAAA